MVITLMIFPLAQMVKKLPAVQETWVKSLGQEDPLEKEMAIHSSILAWRIPQTEDPGGLPSMGFSRQEYLSGVPLPSPKNTQKNCTKKIFMTQIITMV